MWLTPDKASPEGVRSGDCQKLPINSDPGGVQLMTMFNPADTTLNLRNFNELIESKKKIRTINGPKIQKTFLKIL